MTAGCSSTHRDGRVTPKGAESHPSSTFTPHGSGAPTRPEPSPGNWLPTWVGSGMLHPPSPVGHGVGRAARDDNRGRRHAHPQAGVVLRAPKQGLGDVSVGSPLPRACQPGSKREQGPAKRIPVTVTQAAPSAKGQGKFSCLLYPPRGKPQGGASRLRTQGGKGKADPDGWARGFLRGNGGIKLPSEGWGQDGVVWGRGGCSKSAQVNLCWRNMM